jgi:hypothetical protein
MFANYIISNPSIYVDPNFGCYQRKMGETEMHVLRAVAGYRMTDQIFICRRTENNRQQRSYKNGKN